MKKGRLIVISGPSGVGKGTVVKSLLARDPNTWLSVSATTRAIRPSETDGVQYHFISQAEFDRMIAEGSFLEYACYVNNSYGSPLAPIEQKLAEGRDVLLEIEVQGALQIKQKRPDAISVFIAAPSFEALAERLRGRKDTDEAAIAKRLETARQEYRIAPQYDYIVVNDEIETAVADVAAILRAEFLRAENHLKVLCLGGNEHALSPDE